MDAAVAERDQARADAAAARAELKTRSELALAVQLRLEERIAVMGELLSRETVWKERLEAAITALQKTAAGYRYPARSMGRPVGWRKETDGTTD